MNSVKRHVFISYCHADAAWLDRLKIHLRPLVRQTALDVWDDSRLSPGDIWREDIAQALDRARVAVLLVSADFLASDFIANNELPPLLHRAAAGGLLIVPLIVSPCLFSEQEELSRYQCVNSPDKPLSGMSRTDAEAVLVSLGRRTARRVRVLTGLSDCDYFLPPIVTKSGSAFLVYATVRDDRTLQVSRCTGSGPSNQKTRELEILRQRAKQP